ncbi:GNAT family N-acetyltransferase [Mucilaginibacter ginsenosidivorans]|uniref:GNAT family N-acetyltransferase n=1 Tax=Mucilaginibacter ginsenosidivorans TaxID=398053 RepID=A0A5B8V1B7_9SPHI|nr:GNAT family N-acetyltransferase [Mucilaginibacter ginsenosidivorans]QEC65307.1 GNAT family N-acetyltransferase [Mucilaginibacter ginsenosidivorans]
MNLSIEQIRPELTWYLRQKVLYPAQKLYEMEMDEDMDGIHFGAFTDNKLVGIVSLFQKDDDYQFRKFAVDPDYQGKGTGNKLLAYITDFAATEGGKRLWCNARLSATGFYDKNGFSHTGQFFSKNGFDYEILEKPLTRPSDPAAL